MLRLTDEELPLPDGETVLVPEFEGCADWLLPSVELLPELIYLGVVDSAGTLLVLYEGLVLIRGLL